MNHGDRSDQCRAKSVIVVDEATNPASAFNDALNDVLGAGMKRSYDVKIKG